MSKYRQNYLKSYYSENKEYIRNQQLEYGKTFNGKNSRNKAKNKQLEKTKNVVFDHYCGKNWHCMCTECNVCIPEMLTVEHTKNNGKEHREKTKGNNIQIYKDIIKQGFPDDYTILCYNCNITSYRNNGICPHKSNNDWEWEL